MILLKCVEQTKDYLKLIAFLYYF